ncbi:MAG: hypothetical protein LBJ69_00570 [Holosporales bacterium]|nr:hypothetical protein [Holosporales bacterium]
MNNPNSLDLSSSDVAILADVQTAGRGRLNSRTWISVPGNFHCSYIINLERRGVSESCTAELTSTTLNSIRQLLLGLLERREGSGAGQKRIVPADISIKQPNDVLIRGRKVAGVLVEVYYPYAIIGVGINTTSAPLPTSTCILDELSVQVDNREIVTRLHSPSQSSDGDC